jgi:hypothetical protein
MEQMQPSWQIGTFSPSPPPTPSSLSSLLHVTFPAQNLTTMELSSLKESADSVMSEFLCVLGPQASIWPSCLSLSEAFVNVAFTLVVMLVWIFFII